MGKKNYNRKYRPQEARVTFRPRRDGRPRPGQAIKARERERSCLVKNQISNKWERRSDLGVKPHSIDIKSEGKGLQQLPTQRMTSNSTSTRTRAVVLLSGGMDSC